MFAAERQYFYAVTSENPSEAVHDQRRTHNDSRSASPPPGGICRVSRLLERLDRIFSDLPVDRDVQIVTADSARLVPKIVAFISEGTPRSLLGIATARVENVQVQVLDAPYEAIDSFLPPGTPAPQLLLTFELHRDGASSGRWEMVVRTALLPALVQVILAWRHDAFELPKLLVITTTVAGAFGSLFLG